MLIIVDCTHIDFCGQFLVLIFFLSVLVNFLPDVFVFLLNGHILLFEIIYIKSFLSSLKDEWFFLSEYFLPTSVDPEK